MQATEKDLEQDEMIRRNAAQIERNEAAILRQTKALEQIRDHYFPKKSVWKSVGCFLLKVIGVVTVYAGLAETANWYWNTRQTSAMAAQSDRVARRLFQMENDAAGAMRFLEKAVELDSGTIRYRIALAYVKGIATVADLLSVGRPLADDERERVDAILSEAMFLQEVSPKDPMPYVLAAHALRLRGETAEAIASVEKAVALAPGLTPVRLNACALYYAIRDFASAKKHVLEAERNGGTLPFIYYWKGLIALTADGNLKAAQACFAEMARRYPRLALAHAQLGRCLMNVDKPDFVAARSELDKALALASSKLPKKMAMMLKGETYEREGKLVVARLWLDRALEVDGRFMQGLKTRARIAGKAGDWKTAVADLTAAIGLSSFDAELYGRRSEARRSAGDAVGAAEDGQKAEALLNLAGK